MIMFKSLISGVLDKKYTETLIRHSTIDGTYEFGDRDVIGKVKLLKLRGHGEFVDSPIAFQQLFNPSTSYIRMERTGNAEPYTYTVTSTGDAYFSLSPLNLSSSKKYLCVADFSNISTNNTWGFPSDSGTYLKTVTNGRNWWIDKGGLYFDNGVTTYPYPSITNVQIFCLTDMLNAGILTSIPTTYDDFIAQTGLTNAFYPYGQNFFMSRKLKGFKPTSIVIGNTTVDLSSIMAHFPNGLLNSNNVYDEIDFVKKKATKKIDQQTGEPLENSYWETYDFDIGINEYDFGDITIQTSGDVNSTFDFEFYSLQV